MSQSGQSPVSVVRRNVRLNGIFVPIAAQWKANMGTWKAGMTNGNRAFHYEGFDTLYRPFAGGETVSRGPLEPLFQVRILARELTAALGWDGAYEVPDESALSTRVHLVRRALW